MPSLPKFVRRNSVQHTVAADAHASKPSSEKHPLPVDAGEHEFRPPGEHDLRSVCPALNTLANHGYLPRDGKHIHFKVLSHALQAGYGISPLFADFLVLGGYILLRRSAFKSLDLLDIGRHDRIEHNASIVHDDDNNGAKDAPTKVDPELLHRFITKAYSPSSLLSKEKGSVITIEDIAHTRVAREEACAPVDPLHAEVARGEFAMVLDIFGKGSMKTLDAEELQAWLNENRFPPGWTPTHTEHLFDTMSESKKMRKLMMNYSGEAPHGLFSQLEKLVGSQGHGVITALWRVIETMVLKLDLKRKPKMNATTGTSKPATEKVAQPLEVNPVAVTN